MPWPTPLDESISPGESGHLADHEHLHASWNNGHVQTTQLNLTLDYDYSALVVDSSGGLRTITLPETTGTNMNGHIFVIKRSGGFDVVINRSGTDTFDDGATSKTLNSDGAAIGVMSVADGTWYISGERGTVL